MEKGKFFLSATLLQRNNRSKWSFVLVYGPADHGRTEEFLQELVLFVSGAQLPVVVGGDFNLVQDVRDKSNGNINWPRVCRFNDALAAMSLREVCRVGARFTWTNHQLDPIRCVLDRVFVSPGWEALFPLCSLTAITRIGSDHNPLLLNSGEGSIFVPPCFFFQTWWFEVNGFGELVKTKIVDFLGEGGPFRCRIDQWQGIARNTRQFLKGRGDNLGKERKAFKAEILAQIESLDSLADSVGLDEDG
jgi:hypothetical protein